MVCPGPAPDLPTLTPPERGVSAEITRSLVAVLAADVARQLHRAVQRRIRADVRDEVWFQPAARHRRMSPPPPPRRSVTEEGQALHIPPPPSEMRLGCWRAALFPLHRQSGGREGRNMMGCGPLPGGNILATPRPGLPIMLHPARAEEGSGLDSDVRAALETHEGGRGSCIDHFS